MRHRDDIQGFRALAVLLVVLSHAGIPFLTGGFVGVDVFFVLSGFLITGLLLDSATSSRRAWLSEFYVRRARRILPAATLVLVATDIVAYRLLNFVRAKQILLDSIPASLFTANIHFASQGTDYFASAQPPSPIQHFWSLAVEEQFYLVWPAFIILTLLGVTLHRRRGARLYRATTPVLNQENVARLRVVVIVIGAASFAWSIVDTGANPSAAYFSTFARVWELSLGAGLALVASKVALASAGFRAAIGWLGLIGISVAGIAFSGRTPFPGTAALLPTTGAALVIAAGIGGRQPRWAVGRLLSLLPLRYIGDRSYALYLWHWPALIIARIYVGHELSLPANLLLLAGAFALSIVSYRLVESPLRRLNWSPRASVLALWPMSMGLVFLVAQSGLHSIDIEKTRLAAASAPANPGLAPSPGSPQRSVARAQSPPKKSASGALPAVVASVNAAQRGAPIPVGLSPPVDSVTGDHYDFPSGCAPQTDAQTSSTICNLGSTYSRKSIVLIGDSHAQMWMPTILSIAERDGWLVRPIGKSGCTPLNWVGAQGIATCRVWYRWALKHAEGLHPTVTLIAGAWGGSLGPTGDSATIDAIGSTVTAMKRYSKSVVVIADPPQQSKQPVDCLLGQKATLNDCSSTPPPEQSTLTAEVAAATKTAGGGFMDTQGWFCFRNRCPMVIGKTIAFSDTSHVTQTYARELTGTFRAVFRQQTLIR